MTVNYYFNIKMSILKSFEGENKCGLLAEDQRITKK